MSYLDLPRLHFAGNFKANPSTVNNTPSNYDPNVTAPYQSWNPNGTGEFQILNCTVTGVVYTDGTICNTPADDPVVGSAVGCNTGMLPKLVDLDPEQQMVSEIWGMKVQLGTPDGSDSFVGDFLVAAFTDIWFRATAQSAGGDAPMGACYQSALARVKWADVINSRFLQELQQASPAKLSIKFNLDGINMDSGSASFTQGRIVGTIGPALAGEPDHLIAGRFLRSAPGTDPSVQPMTLAGTPASAPMFFAPARLDAATNRLTIDLGNSVSTTTPGGPVNPALGDLRVAVLPAQSQPVLLGQLNCLAPDWYTATAGIQDFDVPADQLDMVETNPLAVVQMDTSGAVAQTMIQENAAGSFVRADNFVFRLNPGETANVKLVATSFGKPAAGQLITFRFDANSINNMQSPPNPASIPIGEPQSALAFPRNVMIGANGQAYFKLSASDPGNPRKFIDGQVYGLRYIWGESEGEDYTWDPTSFISVLVFNGYPQIDEPGWGDIEPIFAQYAKLYPYMRSILDLSDYKTVKENLKSIKHVLSLPKSDPGYMQVTRDLSRDKLNLILRWIEQGAPQ